MKSENQIIVRRKALLRAHFNPRLTARLKMNSSRAQNILGSLNTRVFETRTATGREHSVCQDSGVPHIFILIIHNREKVLSIVNVMCEYEL